MKTVYFDCFAGISGDMTLGALVDAGADFDALKSELEKLAIRHEYELALDRVTKHGISASDVTVKLHHHRRDVAAFSEREGAVGDGGYNHSTHGHHHGHSHGRAFSEIRRIIEDSGLSESVKSKAIAIFTKLGEAEAKIHNKSIEEIHFHEVGAVDAIVDIVGACICLDMLAIDKVYCSAIPTFTGTVEIAHGTFPLPAPATVEMLKNAPWRELGIEGEIVTPTGAAIVATLAESFGPMPPMSIASTGYGAGKKDFGMPNVLRVLVGEAMDGRSDVAGFSGTRSCAAETSKSASETPATLEQNVAIVETNIDDLSPQVYDVVMERLFEAGALDVYFAPIQMKKNRPATLLSVICEHGAVDALSQIIFEETTSIGVRIDTRKRICLEREFTKVDTEYGEITLKIARRNGEILNIQPEYEDCKAAARKFNVAIKRVRDAALIAFHTVR